MRATVILDDDVARALEILRRERGSDLRELSDLVNELLRAGLTQMRGETSRPLFEQQTSAMHARRDVSDVADVLDLLDGEPS